MVVFSSTSNAEHYMEDIIVPALSEIIKEQNIGNETEFDTMALTMKEFCTHKVYGVRLHEYLKPYYKMYFYADKRLWALGDVAGLIGDLANCDECFPAWSEELDLMNIANSWSEYVQSEEHVSDYWEVLEKLLQVRNRKEWEKMGYILADKLLNGGVYGNYSSSEVYAILHGLSMICATNLPVTDKREMFSMMRRKWNFMKHLYSVAFRHVIGSKFKNIIQVVNQIHGHAGHHPYAHLVYDVLADRAEDFCKKTGDEKKLENHLKKIEEVMITTPARNELDELSRVLFPQELNAFLEKNRPQNYQQIKSELVALKKEMAIQREHLNERITQMAGQLRKMAEASVPISDIEEELMRLPEGMAWDVFGQLNNLLMANEVWAKNAVVIRNRILTRMNTPKPQVQAEHYYASGSTHNDGSKHILLANDNKQIGQA